MPRTGITYMTKLALSHLRVSPAREGNASLLVRSESVDAEANLHLLTSLPGGTFPALP